MMWRFVALGGLGAGIGLLALGTHLAWPYLGRMRPDPALPWGLALVGAGVALLILCGNWLIWDSREQCQIDDLDIAAKFW